MELPKHGWIGCNRCYSLDEEVHLFGVDNQGWKIEQPNGSWGSSDPLVIILGFSRGTRQSSKIFDNGLAFKGMRTNLTEILRKLSLLKGNEHVNNRITPSEKNFHFGSLIRCSISMWDSRKGGFLKSGNNILSRCLTHDEANKVALNCVDEFLGCLPQRTRLILLLGNESGYINACRRLFQHFYEDLEKLNDVSYASKNARVTWVHTIHAAAQGNHIPEYLRGADSLIGRKLKPAREAVESSGVLKMLGC